jgi:hypothetical protein
MNTTQITEAALTTLTEYLKEHGTVKTVRVSSAQARGFAKNFSYWGAVRYEIRINRNGRPSNVALERARSRRRSLDLAFDDAAELAEREGRIYLERIGPLTEQDAQEILSALGI